MKKYILFFVSIGLLLATILVYNTISVERSKKVTFNESGYILNGSSERFYFYQNETYTPSYNDKIIFHDTEGAKVTLNHDNFLHYESGNIMALQDSVLLELSRIDDNPIIYYNVGANKEVKKTSNRYTIKNLNEDLQFDQAIWKISPNKYIILGNKINLSLSNGTSNSIEGYVEIQYSDNEIVSIYNQELNYQTISSESYIELDDNIKINLGTKIVSKKNENKMSLEDMVINSDDNVTLVDLNEEDENTIEDENTENIENSTETETQQGGSTSTSTSTTNNNGSNTTTITGQGTTTNNGLESDKENGQDDGKDENTIEIETPDIKYDNSNGTETEINSSDVLAEPKFKFENMKVNALSVKGNIKITDDDDLLSKDDTINIKIINNETGKIVYSSSEEYGMLSIPIDVQSLSPSTQYTLVTSATYIVDEISYSKNFIYKTFVTSDIGVEINKNGFTDTNLNFKLDFSDELLKSVYVSVLDKDGKEVSGETIQNVKNNSVDVNFDDLDPNEEYTVKISNIKYDDAIRNGEDWVLYYEGETKTLKTKPSIDTLNFSVDKRNSNFKLYIEKVTDIDSSIQNYKYIMYECEREQSDDGNVTLVPNTDEIVFERETDSKEITVPVNKENEGGIEREKYYEFVVVAETYDNEKYVEIESAPCGFMIISGREFPTVNFVKYEVTATSIDGLLEIQDIDGAIQIDEINEDNPLTITWKNSIGEEETLIKITDPNAIGEDNQKIMTVDDEGKISFKVDMSKLRQGTTYTFSVYASIDLNDQNGVIKNMFIGSAMVTTDLYKPLKVNFTPEYERLSDDVFSVGLKLTGDEFEEKSLDSVSIILQAGSDYNPSNESWSCEINENNYKDYAQNPESVKSLRELICENTVKLTASKISKKAESNFNDLNYILLVSVSIDGTKYKNEIGLTVDEDIEKGIISKSYTSRENITYSGAAIMLEGKETYPNPPETGADNVETMEIPNRNADDYDLEHNDQLNEDTIIGYNVKAKFNNTTSAIPIKIRYYVWDIHNHQVMDPDKQEQQLIIEQSYNDYQRGEGAVFKLGQGTTADLEEDNKTGMHRGGGYYFSYTVIYNVDGVNKEWPKDFENEGYDEKSLKSQNVYPNKQEPIFVMYPKTSDENSMTYIYSCSDYDKALNYNNQKDETKSKLKLVDNQNSSKEYEIETNAVKKEIKFGVENSPLQKNRVYTAKYEEKLNKATSDANFVTKDLIKQKFEGIIALGENITYTPTYDNKTLPNKIHITFTDNQDTLSRVAIAKVELKYNGSTKTSDFIELSKDTEGQYYIDLDLLSIDGINEFKGQNVQVNVLLFYDNGVIGFQPNDEVKYAAYINTANDEYSYMAIDEGNNFISDESISGNMFVYDKSTTFNTESNEHANLTLKKPFNDEIEGVNIPLDYSGQGLKYGENIIVQKVITEKKLELNKTVMIDDFIIGMKILSKQESLVEVKFEAELKNPFNLQISELKAEICKLEKQGAEAKWDEDEYTEQTINIENLPENNKITFTLTDLAPTSFYKMRFKYKLSDGEEYIYTYDIDDGIIKKEYDFSTLGTINIHNIKIERILESYRNKYLKISYDIDDDKSLQYDKTKYEFFEEDDSGELTKKVKLTENNIMTEDKNNRYSVDTDGSLIVTNQKEQPFSSVTEQININPDYNVFTFGKTYKLVITPIVTHENEEVTIKSEEIIETKSFKKLDSPTIQMRMKRSDGAEGSKYITTSITIVDSDHVICNDDSNTNGEGTYKLKAYKYEEKNAEKEEENIYDSFENGTQLSKDKVYNLKEHATNYQVFIRNAEYTKYYYDIDLKYKVNIENKKDNAIEKTETRTLQKIENNAGVEVGTIQAVKNSVHPDMIDINFYNSYQLNKINKVQYTIYNVETNEKMTGECEPTENVVDSENIGVWQNMTDNGLWRLTLPEKLKETGTYSIELNFYCSNEFIDTKEAVYSLYI